MLAQRLTQVVAWLPHGIAVYNGPAAKYGKCCGDRNNIAINVINPFMCLLLVTIICVKPASLDIILTENLCF